MLDRENHPARQGVHLVRDFGPLAETTHTGIFWRVTAWQNWIVNRANAVGDKGALKVFGSGSKASFDWERV